VSPDGSGAEAVAVGRLWRRKEGVAKAREAVHGLTPCRKIIYMNRACLVDWRLPRQ
jgi:hypothetical protein